jgi:hypothetical protein
MVESTPSPQSGSVHLTIVDRITDLHPVTDYTIIFALLAFSRLIIVSLITGLTTVAEEPVVANGIIGSIK